MQAYIVRRYMKILGIEISNEEGYCYGLASVERNAFLLGDSEYTRHRQRIDYMTGRGFIEQFEHFIGHEKFGNCAEVIADDLKKWPSLLNYAVIHFDKPTNQITGADLYQIYLEIRGFLEMVAISQRPDHYSLLFNKKDISQHNDITIPFTQSLLAEKQGGVYCLGKVTNSYTSKEMESYLTYLGEVITQRFAMILSVERHTIMLAYNAEAQTWNVSNNAMSIIFTKDKIPRLVEELWSCFFDPSGEKDLLLMTDIYLSGPMKEKVQSSFFSSDIYRAIRQETYDKTILLGNQLELLSTEASSGNIQAVQELLAHCRGDILSSKFTALHLAAKEGHTETVRILLKHDCEKNNIFRNKTALSMAAENGYEEIVRILLEYNCEKDIAPVDGYTALHIAVKNGHEKVVSALLEGGCSPDVRNTWGDTPLHMAVQEGKEKIVQILLERGCKKDIKNFSTATALHLAVQEDHDKIVQLLLKHAANSGIKNNHEQTPLDIAKYQRKETISKLLEEDLIKQQRQAELTKQHETQPYQSTDQPEKSLQRYLEICTENDEPQLQKEIHSELGKCDDDNNEGIYTVITDSNEVQQNTADKGASELTVQTKKIIVKVENATHSQEPTGDNRLNENILHQSDPSTNQPLAKTDEIKKHLDNYLKHLSSIPIIISSKENVLFQEKDKPSVSINQAVIVNRIDETKRLKFNKTCELLIKLNKNDGTFQTDINSTDTRNLLSAHRDNIAIRMLKAIRCILTLGCVPIWSFFSSRGEQVIDNIHKSLSLAK